jgi:hypothetical protein
MFFRVPVPASDEGMEQLDGYLANPPLPRLNALRSEAARDQRPLTSVPLAVHGQDPVIRPRLPVRVAQAEIAAEGIGIEARREHVVEARDRPEIQLLVVMNRSLIA